ncbi:MAG: L-aspartate oxidase [Calditrichaeota bacterium]|nr:L-aspartate oxidase [Calditrichota bacterium]MCB9367889.1 L-aspartate oxidase [Calditrichota bacterium]
MSLLPQSVDVIIVGSGIAGLSMALHCSKFADVLLITKKNSAQSATNWAQGGIAAVTATDDDFKLHETDTMTAGAGLCVEDVVEMVVQDAPKRVDELMQLGVRFSKRDGEIELAREGGHSRARILHHKDQTGQEIESVLLSRVTEQPRVHLLEHHVMVDLLVTPRPKAEAAQKGQRCFGVYVLDSRNGAISPVTAKAVVLATGGAGMVYQHTTNPAIATGDGVAAAYRAGAVVSDMEFFQFHPTTMYDRDDSVQNHLITEALRGAGAKLRTQDGIAFMEKYDSRAELAPRDIVARAIDAELKRTGDAYVLLDCTHLDADPLRARFPYIDQSCKDKGFDFTEEPIWVVPAAHYQCGGIETDKLGRSSIQGLYAIGEVACTGLHGANRLASNSLLEAVVFAANAAENCEEWLKSCPPVPQGDPWSSEGTHSEDEAVLLKHNIDEIRRTMWSYVGIVRTTRRLKRARNRLDLLTKEIAEFYQRTQMSPELVELRNLVLVADLIVRSALDRKESRGLHYSTDYPSMDTSAAPRHSRLSRLAVLPPSSAR